MNDIFSQNVFGKLYSLDKDGNLIRKGPLPIVSNPLEEDMIAHWINPLLKKLRALRKQILEENEVMGPYSSSVYVEILNWIAWAKENTDNVFTVWFLNNCLNLIKPDKMRDN